MKLLIPACDAQLWAGIGGEGLRPEADNKVYSRSENLEIYRLFKADGINLLAVLF